MNIEQNCGKAQFESSCLPSHLYQVGIFSQYLTFDHALRPPGGQSLNWSDNNQQTWQLIIVIFPFWLLLSWLALKMWFWILTELFLKISFSTVKRSSKKGWNLFSGISMGIGQRRIRIATFVVSDETLSLEKKHYQIGGHLLLPKSLNQGFLAQQKSCPSSRGLSSLWNCAHTAETIVRQPACFDFFAASSTSNTFKRKSM